MFFYRNSTSCFTQRSDDGICIYWFYSVNIYYLCIDTFFLQDYARLDGVPYHMTAGENGNICSFGKILSFTNNKIFGLCKDGPYRAAKPQVNRANMICNGNGCRLC